VRRLEWTVPATFLLVLGMLLAGRSQEAVAASCDSSGVQIPTPQELRALPLSEHPRLYASQERFQELKKQIASDDRVGRWYERVKRQADQYVADESLPRYVREDGKRMDASGHVLRRVRTLALVYRIEGDDKYAERAWEELEAAASFPDWNPSHFLDVAGMTQGFATGYDWLYDAWTEKQRRVLREAIIEKGLQAAMNAYQEGDQGPHWAELEGVYNWGQVTNSSIGLGALAVMDERPKVASRVLYEALRRLPGSMGHYAPDGGWIEGVHYWGYATRNTAKILDALGQTFGTTFGLAQMPGFSETGYFPIYMTGPSGRSFNHSDSAPHDNGGPQLFWMAEQFNHPAYAWHQWKMAEGGRPMNLIWYTPEVAEMAAKRPDLPLSRHFKASHIALFRSAWEDPEALFLGFKGGDTGASHAHLDVGSFLLEVLGERWAVELGAENYNIGGYFAMDTKRWIYYRTRAEGQNTLVIEPGETPDQSITAVSEITRFQSQSERPFAIADLTPAYADHVQSAKRGVALLNGRRQVLVQDEVQSNEPVEAWWFMHTKADVQIGADASTAVLRQNGKRLQAKLLTPVSAQFTVKKARPLLGSPDPKKQNKNKGIRKLSIHFEDMTDQRIAVLLTPLQEGQQAPEPLPTVQALEAW